MNLFPWMSNHKNAISFMLIGSLCLFLSSPGLLGQEAQIISIQGRVEVQLPQQSIWSPAVLGQPLVPGSTLSVGLRSQAVIEFPGSLLEIPGLSRVTLEDLEVSAQRIQTRLSIPVGRVRAEVQNVEGLQQEFSLRSPVATAAVRGTSFTFDGQNVEVFSGTVLVENTAGQNTLVQIGESALIVENQPLSEPIDTYNRLTQVRTLVNPSRDTPLRVVLPTGFSSGLIIRLPDFGGGE